MPQASVIVVGNEKGGAGKSTIAIHLATALLHGGARRWRCSTSTCASSRSAHFFANRRAWLDANGAVAPMPHAHDRWAPIWPGAEDEALARFEDAFAEARDEADFVLIDTPGGDTAISRAAHGLADLIVTPMNDSFVDFDMLGVVDPGDPRAEAPQPLFRDGLGQPQGARRSASASRSTGWCCATAWPPPRRATASAWTSGVEALSRRVGFRIGPGLRDRVIYRELFPFGLTVADLSPTIRPVACRCSTWRRARSCAR